MHRRIDDLSQRRPVEGPAVDFVADGFLRSATGANSSTVWASRSSGLSAPVTPAGEALRGAEVRGPPTTGRPLAVRTA